MAQYITPLNTLVKRIEREFPHEKLIGNIVVTDEEFELLTEYFQLKYHYMVEHRPHFIIDPVFCVALVQIGIRFYDGGFWPHVRQILNYAGFNINHHAWIRASYNGTMKTHKKILIGASDGICNILLHGFVSNEYAHRFFDFLFAFYRIDLERDISRLSTELMSDLIDIMMLSDNTERTYFLVEHTAAAIRMNPHDCKTIVRSCLGLIDRAFWGEDIQKNSDNRLTRLFVYWKDSSETFGNERKYHTSSGNVLKGKKSFSSPYIKHDRKNLAFHLILPPQSIRFDSYEELYWNVCIDGNAHRIDINPYTQGVTGYKTEEERIIVHQSNIFSSIVIKLITKGILLRHFKITKEVIRFFDNDGDFIGTDNLVPGEAYSFTPADFIPISDAVIESECYGHLLYTLYNFENGDIIRLPDGKPVSVGHKISEGLLPRGLVNGVLADLNNESVPVYKAPPAILAKLLPRRSSGTAIIINKKVFRMYEAQTLVIKAVIIDLFDRSGEQGYLFSLKDFDCTENGFYEVCIDVPGDRTNLIWRFALINGLTHHFEDAPYVFRTRGTICLPDNPVFLPRSVGVEKDTDTTNNFNFDIVAGESRLLFTCDDISLGFDLPVLSYKFGDGEWQISQHTDIWHKDFEPRLFVRYNTDKLKISLDYGENEHSHEQFEFFTKIKVRDIFECDLNRFRSWFGKSIAKRQVFIELSGCLKPIPFLGVITKSSLISGYLQGNFDSGILSGEFHIVGHATYFVDLYFNGYLFARKLPLTEGKFIMESVLETGAYEAILFESEDDDSGFGEVTYFEIGRKMISLLNPENICGKSLLIKTVKPGERSASFLGLSCTYKILNLKLKCTLDKHNYIGKMIVEGVLSRVLASFYVNVEFYDLGNLNFCYITFCDGEDNVEFLYDEQKRIIVKNEEVGLTRAQAYRRYKQSLYPEDYVFVIDFLDAIDQQDIRESPIALLPMISALSTSSINMSLEKNLAVEAAQNNTLSVTDGELLNDTIMVANLPQETLVDVRSREITSIGLSPITYNCLRNAGFKIVEDICRLVEQKGVKGLNNINKLSSNMRSETIDFLRRNRLI